MQKRILRYLIFCLTAVVAACGGDKVVHNNQNHNDGHHHHHEPPHGGVPVVLGNEEFHLELLIDNSSSKMMMYILDAHMEDFIRISSNEIAMKVSSDGTERELKFMAQSSNSTGETVGDTSFFAAEDDVIKELTEFEVVIPEISIKGSTYTNVAFPFPEGNEPH